MLEVDTFSHQVKALSERLFRLLSSEDSAFKTSPEGVSILFKELGVAVEELQISAEELKSQNDELIAAISRAEQESRQYENLFQLAPQPCLTTDLSGSIRAANRMAVQLLGLPAHVLKGKPLVLFFEPKDQPRFWQALAQAQQQDTPHDWEIQLKTSHQGLIDIACSILVSRHPNQTPEEVRWVLRDITEHKRLAALAQLDPTHSNDEMALLLHRPVASFAKGDTISMQPGAINYVTEGIVKMTTLTDQNKEVLLSLAGPGSPFGPFLTRLPIYEVTALSDVLLVSIPLSEIMASPNLCRLLFAKTSQRLKQAERLLIIAGEYSASRRLDQLLQFLKTEIGEPVPEGVRLKIRLTHEDLANACGSTRVTTTRLIGKLQRSGKVKIDNQSHIILIGETP